MPLDDIWLHPRDRTPLNGYSTIKILHCPFNHEVFLSFFHETGAPPPVSLRICSALFVENMRLQITLYERKRASFVEERLTRR